MPVGTSAARPSLTGKPRRRRKIMIDRVDAQLHAVLPPSEDFPWAPEYAELASKAERAFRTPEELITMMDGANVGAAVLVTPSIYGSDNSLALHAWQLFPDRFRVIGRIDATRVDIAEQLSSWLEQPGMVGVRLTIVTNQERQLLTEGAFEPFFAAAELNEIPVMIYPLHAIGVVGEIARRYSNLSLVVDHMGLPQPPLMEPYSDPFEPLPQLLAVGCYENVAIKLTGITSLSTRPYPFLDLTGPVEKLLKAFGPARILWGTDATVHDTPYEEAVGFLGEWGALSSTELDDVMGRSMRRLLRWSGDSRERHDG
jgi:L-fuconolactonase